MSMRVQCLDNRPYYDLEILKKAKRPIDKLYYSIINHNGNLPKYYKNNSAFKQFHNITLQLVLDFKLPAKDHIQELLNNSQYGILYYFAKMNQFNSLYIDYNIFPLIDQEEHESIISEIKSIASKICTENTSLYNITCLELLYFFAVLVNPSYNWITMDYLSNCNKSHQYIVSTDTVSKICNI